MSEHGVRERTAQPRVSILLSGPLTFGAAGLANSVIARASTLANAGWDVRILVDVWQPDLQEHVNDLKAHGRLADDVDVKNLFKEMAEHASQWGKRAKLGSASPTAADYVDQLRSEVDPDDDRKVRYYDGSRYVYFAWLNAYGGINFLDELVDAKRTRRLTFDKSGWLARITQHQESGEVATEEYISDNGSVYFKVEFGRGGSGARSLVLTPQLTYTTIAGHLGLLRTWLEEYCQLTEDDILISEYAFKLNEIEHAKLSTGNSVIYTLHNNHLGPPYRFNALVKPELRETLSRMSEMDALVVLTPQQKFDIQKLYPKADNIHVVSHAARADSGIQRSAGVTREPNLMVSVGRLTKIKGHAELIRSFRSVLAQRPDAILEIWGRGDAEDDLRSLIAELDLDHHVRLCGFVNNPVPIYQRASVALFPSRMEGQPLVLMEAMQQGCVPVVYDFKYGARMMVTDLEDGIIVDFGDFDDLIRSAGQLLRDPVFCQRLSGNAVRKMETFSEERMIDEWRTVFRYCDRVGAGGQ